MKLGFGWGLALGVAGYWAFQHLTGMGNTGKASTQSGRGKRGGMYG